jgi:hypothetical protein
MANELRNTGQGRYRSSCDAQDAEPLSFFAQSESAT